MFKKSEMFLLAKRNLRYRILRTKDPDEYYLLDVESPFLIVYFLPLLIYFIPHRCYPLSQEEYDKLSKSEEENEEYKSWLKNQTSLGRNVGIGIGAMLLAGLFDINQYLNFDVAEYGNFSKSLTVLILLAVFGLRVWLTRAYKLPEILRNRTYKRLYIFPKSIKSSLGALLCYLFTLFSGGGLSV